MLASGCGRALPPAPEPGVPLALARERAETLSDLCYELSFDVPAERSERVRGRARISLTRRAGAGPLVLDFDAPAGSLLALRVLPEGRAARHRVENGHVVIAEEELREGRNTLELEFLAGDAALNRQRDFLYTLFVPARAHLAFPCFDQPDLKARYRLSLEIPAEWEALSNGGVAERAVAPGGRTRWRFEETPPISAYLFAFAAGRFRVEEAERAGRTLRFLHRESDPGRIARNREAIFDLHAGALAWLEEYTGIAYPFRDFAFALIPAFQFGGMEHPGAVYYRDTSLLLDDSATQGDVLERASLIAHETAHMWFGDLVTMRWFDDVWMKEVFANLMAAKIAHPAFPGLDHELRFLLAHHPAAYAVDRSAGANPIRQELGNLAEAGSLYGAIIYRKAPIALRQLEALVGEEAFRDGVREYLQRYRFANAAWPELIAILDRRGGEDLAEWSRVWVGEPGRPTVAAELRLEDGRVASLLLAQSDPQGRGRLWSQRLDVALGRGGSARILPVRLSGETAEVEDAAGEPAPEWVVPGAGGMGYGRFALDAGSRAALLERLGAVEPAPLRGAAWLALWDERLEGRVSPGALWDAALGALRREEEALLVERLLEDLRELYWRHLPAGERRRRAPELEELLWRRLHEAQDPQLCALWLRAYRDMAVSGGAVARLGSLWSGELELPGLPLSERDRTALALELAVREAPGSETVLEEQLARIDDPDRRERLAFVAPALSPDPAVRDAFFESLADPARREREPWVLEALRYLHHPLRAARSERYIRPSLELLPELRRTGDIFFPKRWLDATLGGHRSASAAALVRGFLEEHPELEPRLRGKLLQSADPLLRIGDRGTQY